jgi:hypothetical protein
MNRVSITFVDPIVESVTKKFITRSNVGHTKYGTTLKDNDGPVDYWMNHIQEELMDALLYIEKTREVLKQIRADEKIKEKRASSSEQNKV